MTFNHILTGILLTVAALLLYDKYVKPRTSKTATVASNKDPILAEVEASFAAETL